MTRQTTRRFAVIVGINIATRRKSKGWTQAMMAKVYAISPDSLSRMERGFIAPRFSPLEALAIFLDCMVADLFRIPEELQAEYASSHTNAAYNLAALDPKDTILEHT